MAHTLHTQTREIKAAVVRKKGGPFQIETLSLEEPRPDEVLVRIVATGMCHTDMVARDQLYTVPLPVVLGHEGAGVVEQVGSSVKKVAQGDHVVLTYMWCGHCQPCLRGDLTYCANFYTLNFGGAREDGSAATHDTQGLVHDHVGRDVDKGAAWHVLRSLTPWRGRCFQTPRAPVEHRRPPPV